MSQGFAEQIAVLDGLDGLGSNSFSDGRIGQTRARVDHNSRKIMRGVLARKNVLDASSGANYSGGSSYAPGLPLMPSSVGLAMAEGMIGGGYGRAGLGGNGMSGTDSDLAMMSNVMEATRRRKNVIDASEGANYSGGSSYAPGLPLMPSSVGLAGAIPNVLPTRRHVVDYSGGANYSGGSSYSPGLPLMPSSAGLAGLDDIGDQDLFEAFPNKSWLKKFAGRARLQALKAKSRAASRNPAFQMGRGQALQAQYNAALAQVRAIRKQAAAANISLRTKGARSFTKRLRSIASRRLR